MKNNWTITSAAALVLHGSQNGFYDKGGNRNPDLNNQFGAMDEVFRDAMFLAGMGSPRNSLRSDWLANLKEISERNRQKALDIIVKERLVYDKDIPLWLYYVSRECTRFDLRFSPVWFKLLENALKLVKDGYRGEINYLVDDARKALKAERRRAKKN